MVEMFWADDGIGASGGSKETEGGGGWGDIVGGVEEGSSGPPVRATPQTLRGRKL